MRKINMKKVLTIVATLGVIVTGLAVSGNAQEARDLSRMNSSIYSEKQAAIVNNNLYDISKSRVEAMTDMKLPTIKGAQHVSYNVINPGAKDQIAEMDFVLDGVSVSLRLQKTDLEEPKLTMTDDELTSYDISGMYFNWDDTGISKIYVKDNSEKDKSEETCFLYANSSEGVGYAMWKDPHTGILYNATMMSDANCDTLYKLAEKVVLGYNC